MKNKKNYTEEFKRQAVKLAEDLGSTMAAGRELGVSDVNIHYWKRKFSGKELISVTRKPEVKREELVDENQRLRQEVAQLKKVNHILKAAAAFFSQDHLK